MNASFRPTVVAGFVAAIACTAVGVSAQTVATPRAPQGVFGGVRPTSEAKTRLDLTASLVEGYDDNVPTQFRQTLDPTSLQSGGFSTILNATGAYAWSGKRAQVGATGASNVRHFADLGETRSMGHNAGVGLTLLLPARTSLLINQAAASSPTFMYDLFPTGAAIEAGAAPTTAADYRVATFESYLYTTTAVMNHVISPRARFSATGDYSYTNRLHENPTWQDVSAHSLRGDYSQNVGRNTSLSVQYRYRTGDYGYGGGAKTTEQGVDFGADVVRPLSATRRTTFSFKLGVSAAEVPETLSGALVVRRQYLTVGQVGFGYEFARTWRARANYRRGLEYVVDFPQPVSADGVGFSLAGLLARRVDLLVSAGYSSGESLLNRNNLSFDTYTGNVRLRYGVSRTVATYVEYLYYYYDFRGTTDLAAGIPPGLERNGVRMGLTLWVPAVRR